MAGAGAWGWPLASFNAHTPRVLSRRAQGKLDPYLRNIFYYSGWVCRLLVSAGVNDRWQIHSLVRSQLWCRLLTVFWDVAPCSLVDLPGYTASYPRGLQFSCLRKLAFWSSSSSNLILVFQYFPPVQQEDRIFVWRAGIEFCRLVKMLFFEFLFMKLRSLTLKSPN